jgi:hypothetical protein
MMNGTLDSEVRLVSLCDIRPSPENTLLYAPVDPASPDVRDLAQSIAARGVLEPLVITVDGYILSGHRRYAAAQLAGLTVVPVRIAPVHHGEEPDAVMQFLRECNRQRDKTAVEKVREELVTVSPADAYEALIAARQKAAQIAIAPVRIEGSSVRKAISPAKAPMLAAVMTVLQEVLWDYLPTSIRKIHYELLNLLPLRHASKPDSHYENTRKCYQDLSDLITRARFAGLIPWEWITDETRPCDDWQTWGESRTFVREQLDGFLQDYARNLQQTQPNHIEIVCEKNTVRNIVRGVAAEYCIPLTSGRGFSAVERYYKIMQRYRMSGKERLIVLTLTDFDPEGEEIVQVVGRTLRDNFGIAQVDVVKAELTVEQVRQYALPTTIDAKVTSSNYKKFVRKYGTSVHELEALAPQVQQDLLRQAIDSVLDIDAFNAELEREKEDAAFLAMLRQRCLTTLRNGLDNL